MNKHTGGLFFCFFLISIKLFAQSDAYSGTWEMKYVPAQNATPVHISLQIASSDKNILYPAHLTLQCDSFTARYELLLVKKNSRELGISRNKYPVFEKPFSLGNCASFLNGVFDYSRDLKGNPTLNIKRIKSKESNTILPDTVNFNKTEKAIAVLLKNFLKEADIQLTKTNDLPLKTEEASLVLNPGTSGSYFGISDTIQLKNRIGTIDLSGYKKKGNDIVSASLNGKTIIYKEELSKKKYTNDIFLDTGLNIITFFADNFGSEAPNAGKLDLQFGNKKTTLDFTNKRDSAATFIVAMIYCYKDEEDKTDFQYNPAPQKPLQKNEKLISSIISKSRNLTFAIWDDAAEDGDSISINIDGRWIVQGFPVKKAPQFLNITLNPGANVITFIADNLGAIPPNTSVLEIIDGKKRKAFTIETGLGESNLLRIYYDVNTGL